MRRSQGYNAYGYDESDEDEEDDFNDRMDGGLEDEPGNYHNSNNYLGQDFQEGRRANQNHNKNRLWLDQQEGHHVTHEGYLSASSDWSIF